MGEGAIESIIAARESGGDFRSLTDFCSRVDLRLANRKVLESLAKVGALNVVGHPAQVLLGLDDALAAGQAAQRDRITGQTSLFDMGGDEGIGARAAAPGDPRDARSASGCAGRRSCWGCTSPTTRWARSPSASGQFVTAYSGDLKDESLDGQRVVLGGIVTGIRTVITKTKSTMAVVTLEDLQGTLEVVVFPRTYEQTIGTWRDGAILLVAGRVDHRGEEASLLADAVWDWDTVAERGPEAFAREVGALDRRGGGRRGRAAAASGQRVTGTAAHVAEPVAVGPGEADGGVARRAPVRRRRAAGLAVGVRRPSEPRRSPASPRREPIATYAEPPDLASRRWPRASSEPDEPPLPDEQRDHRRGGRPGARAPRSTRAPGAVLNVRFAREAGPERVVSAMQAFKAVLRERPGGTRVVVHVPAPGGLGAADGAARRRLRRRAARRGAPARRRRGHRPQPRLSGEIERRPPEEPVAVVAWGVRVQAGDVSRRRRGAAIRGRTGRTAPTSADARCCRRR